MAKLPTIQKIKSIIGQTWFDIEADEGSNVVIESRRHGDVGEETPGREDVREGNRIFRLLTDALKDDGVSVNIEAVDEWVMIQIRERS